MTPNPAPDLTPTVLLLTGDDHCRRSLAAALRAAGLAVVEPSGGVPPSPPDVILMDARSGDLEMLKLLEADPSVPVFYFASGDVPAASGGAALDPPELVERLREAVARRGGADDLHRQKMENLGRLAAGVAHDLNNLLTVILGHVSLLGDAPARDAERATMRAADLTSQLLGLARPAADEPRLVDLNAAAGEIDRLLSRTFLPNVRRTLDLEPGPVHVRAARGPVTQVLLNLCLNARDAMPRGGELTVQTRVVRVDPAELPGRPQARAGAFGRVTVTDTGTGIPAEVMGRLFEPYFTTKGPGRGTGLGLSVVDRVARDAGGWVECASEPGRGTRFDVYLPYEPAAAAEPPRLAPPRPAVGRTVLFADEDPSIRALGQMALERHGYRVVPADGPAAAAAAVRAAAGRIDLVVMDLSRPPRGPDPVAELRSADPSVGVLLTSGLGTPEAAGGAAGVLAKPFTAAQLVRAVENALDGHPWGGDAAAPGSRRGAAAG